MRSFILSQCRDLRMGVMRRFRSFNHRTCKTVLNLLLDLEITTSLSCWKTSMIWLQACDWQTDVQSDRHHSTCHDVLRNAISWLFARKSSVVFARGRLRFAILKLSALVPSTPLLRGREQARGVAVPLADANHLPLPIL